MSINPIDSEVWGAWFGTDQLRELFSDRAQIQLMLEVEAALARAQSKLGLVPPEIAETISAAAKAANLDMGSIAESTRRVGYPVVALVRELGQVCGADAARYVHLGATTQDILDTALVLQLRAAVGLIRRDLVELARALARRAKQYRDTPMAARTHLQHAVPTTFGLKCAQWAAPLKAHVERLDQATRRVMVVQFGGAAGTLAALGEHGPAVAEQLAKELELGAPAAPWHTQRDGLAEVAGVMALICGSLAKFAGDIALLMQSEVGEVAEPHQEGRGGSSTMPQKRNPIASEYILAAVRAVHALVPIMFGAMTADHERATGPWQAEALALPQIIVLTGGALAHSRSIADGMTVDTQRMRRNLELTGGLIMAEAIATALTPRLGRTEAEAAVQRACNRALAERRALAEILRSDPQLVPQFADSELRRILEPASYLGAAGALVDRVAAMIEQLT